MKLHIYESCYFFFNGGGQGRPQGGRGRLRENEENWGFGEPGREGKERRVKLGGGGRGGGGEEGSLGGGEYDRGRQPVSIGGGEDEGCGGGEYFESRGKGIFGGEFKKAGLMFQIRAQIWFQIKYIFQRHFRNYFYILLENHTLFITKSMQFSYDFILVIILKLLINNFVRTFKLISSAWFHFDFPGNNL